MTSITINKKPVDIPSLSDLSFGSFNTLFSKDEGVSTTEYIAFFVNMDVKDLINAKVEKWFEKLLHHNLLDVNVQDVIEEKRESFKLDDEIHIVDDLRLETFGQMYFFDLYYSQLVSGGLNMYELSLRCLACALADISDMDMGEVDKMYNKLSNMRWVEVLPVGFFLLKNALKKKRFGLATSIKFTLELRNLTKRNSFRQMRSKNTRKS